MRGFLTFGSCAARRSMLAAALILVVASPAAAQDKQGKLPEFPKTWAYNAALSQGAIKDKGVILYFFEEG